MSLFFIAGSCHLCKCSTAADNFSIPNNVLDRPETQQMSILIFVNLWINFVFVNLLFHGLHYDNQWNIIAALS